MRYDTRGVPHIFAANSHDLYRALGYVVARDRLFQMELQTRAAAGRLAELAGARALPLDVNSRRLGVARGADRRFAALDSAGPTRRADEAFAAGVNAWIAQLDPTTLPLEYRLLGTRPLPWDPKYTMYLQGQMSVTLALDNGEINRAAAAGLVGDAAATALYPPHAPIVEPIEPNGDQVPRIEPLDLPDPGPPDAAAASRARVLAALPHPDRLAGAEAAGDALGSNNWAVAPSRSASGHALLAGDPHLELSLPSIWYEVHLVVKDSLDVYGITIPGLPMVVIGFNRDVAWSFTNTGADVYDYYRETVDDERAPTRYQVDGAWRPLTANVERYLGKHGETLAVDTLRRTHRGPLRHTAAGWVSTRWTALEPSDEIAASIAGARATTAAEFERAMEGYRVPAQNMMVADRAGTIAIRSTGRFPVRPTPEAGMVMQDGSSAAADWTGDLPPESYPHATSPTQGWLASANQEPKDPRTDPTYFGADWPTPWRAIRINQLLAADHAVTPDAMRQWQTDRGNVRADWFVPLFLTAVDAERALGRAPDAAISAASLLGSWDRRFTRTNTRAVLFELAMQQLAAHTWDELTPARTGADSTRVTPGRLPSDMVLYALTRSPESGWWDDRRTAAHENRDAIFTAALADAYAEAVTRYGTPDAGGWTWSKIRSVNINHLLRLRPLGRYGLPPQGGTGTLSPNTPTGANGASWRMVVELGPELHAWAIYPGGQSGNPLSRRYDDRLRRWTDGVLDTLVVPATLDDPRVHWASRLRLEGSR